MTVYQSLPPITTTTQCPLLWYGRASAHPGERGHRDGQPGDQPGRYPHRSVISQRNQAPGQDHERQARHRGMAGRKRPAVSLNQADGLRGPPASQDMLADLYAALSSAHASTVTIKASTGRRLVHTSTATITAATHEPSQATAFMTELSAAVHESTTMRVTCWSTGSRPPRPTNPATGNTVGETDPPSRPPPPGSRGT